MRQVFKQDVGVSGKKFVDSEVDTLLKKLWDEGKSKREIARKLNVSLATIDRRTKGWPRDYIERNFRTFDYHIAYCLLYEHKLTFKEAAFALEVEHRSLHSIMARNKEKLDKSFPIWKKLYLEKRVYQEDTYLMAAE